MCRERFLCRRGFQVVGEEINRGKVAWAKEETGHNFRVVTLKNAVYNMTKIVNWRGSPRCRLYFLIEVFVKMNHKRGGRI